MENIEYWIWLQQALGAGSPKPDRLIYEFGGIENIYNAEQGDYIKTGFLSRKEITRLCSKSLSKCENIVDSCLKKGYSILPADQMPQRLRDIYAPPCVLYVWGKLPQNGGSLYISMVGTRNVTAYGTEAATKIAAGLAHCGAVVVSGLAVGVDAASHKGTLKSGGKTVAVIGCGLNINYPAVNSELKRFIAQSGAVVSEYPPDARPLRANFPIRNRIIAGLSQGTVVVEAGKRSGALITASLAAEMGRDVFAVPGSIFSPMSEGTNSLLKDGAKPVCTVVDIIEEYVGLYPQSIIQNDGKNTQTEQLSFNVKKENQNSTVNKKSNLPAKNIAYNTKRNNILEKASANPSASGGNGSHIDGFNDAERRNDISEKTAENLPAAGVKSAKNGIYSNNAERRNNISEKTAENLPAAGVKSAKNGIYSNNAERRNNISEKTAENLYAAGVPDAGAKVYGLLDENPRHVDDIALAANMEVRKVLATLTTLEIEGFVKSYPGKRYAILIKK